MATETAEDTSADAPPAPPQIGFPKKTLYWIAAITIALWAFAIMTGSMIFMIILGVLTAVLAFVLFRAFAFIRKQRGVVDILQTAQ